MNVISLLLFLAFGVVLFRPGVENPLLCLNVRLYLGKEVPDVASLRDLLDIGSIYAVLVFAIENLFEFLGAV